MRSWQPSLKARLALTFGLLILVIAVVMSVAIGAAANRQIKAEVGQSLTDVAFQISDRLDRSIFERYRDLVLGARLGREQVDRRVSIDSSLLTTLHNTYTDFAWIGFARRDGRVATATEGMLEDVDVSHRPWFQAGLEGVYFGDVHEALLLAERLPEESDDAPPRFVDIAMPVRDRDGVVVGVLGAHLRWRWAQSIKRSVLSTQFGRGRIQVLIVGADNRVLLGPPSLQGTRVATPPSADGKTTGYAVTAGQQDQRYLTGYSVSNGYRDFPGLGWRILVRQRTELAYARASDLRRQILVAGALLSLLFVLIGWRTAHRIAAPLDRISAAADRIRRGDTDVHIPEVKGYSEVSVLARTLSDLLADVIERDGALQELNASLEARVRGRTEELQQANSELSVEIAQRRHIEAEREQLIARLEELASTDALTGIPNRRHFNETAAAEIERALRLRHPLALVLLDIDHFKRVNDSYGHATGDKVLRRTATYCRSMLREMDTLARIGGEEFAMLLPDTDAITARSTAERLRRGVEAMLVETRKGQVGVTVSVGVSGLAEDDRGIEDVLRRADRALYRAKDEGRNRIVVG